MTDRVSYLSVDEAIAIHETLVERFGGRRGLRDAGLLEASLYRPQTGCYDDLAKMAAALFESLLFNHAFHDANRRLAFFATDVFLRINGHKLIVSATDGSEFIASLDVKGHSQKAAVLPLMRRYIKRL